MDLRILRAVDQPVAPWRNGRGLTRQVAVFPPGASLEDFKWRASIAEISKPGSFSAFLGIVRMLSVLDGQLLLATPPLPERLVGSGEPPIVFAGDDPAWGWPLLQPVYVFNLMLHRRWRADVRWHSGVAHNLAADVLLVAREPTQLTIGARSVDLAPHDVAHLRQGNNFSVDLSLLRVDLWEE
ncbi:hypothetical protein C1T17_18510 [Sphingobium sp. SCG-1]|uniref:HutD/Ves family protein n=1 Tax=Sphingobium sp. SCG-1 TaxID=2072936 RepID=UPI000CD68EC4|nr:HutD family protein [Sphingobium sp. SCG-1]AUW59770.1 hypothetical protein C1T17_18510 [Sphingobium sp. SCG-1]